MTQSFTLFEHETKEFDWTDRDLIALEQVSRVTGQEILHATIRHGKRVLQATQYVGVFRFGNTSVQVLPKIYQSSLQETEPNYQQEATRNLLYLLNYTLQLPIREYEIASLAWQKQDWFELLLHLFTVHLLEEWQRGAYCSYQEIEDELPALKGKWRISNHLRHPERRHLFAVTYDEFVVNNPLNRVFRFVVERLWQITSNALTRQRLGSLRQWMEDVTLLPTVTITDANIITITRLNQRFAPLLELAKLFLEKSTLQLATGEISTFAFVFDMNQLFESFLINFIRRHSNEILPSTLQMCELLPQSRGASLFLATRIDTNVSAFRLKPDLAFYNRASDSFPLLIDMKYKRLTSQTGTSDISQDDFYQMYAYAQRYQCSCVLLLYPQTIELLEPLCRRFALREHEKMIVAATVDMRVNLNRKEEQQELKNRLKRILTLECGL